MKIYVKNLCCNCCENYVKEVASGLNMGLRGFRHGELELEARPEPEEVSRLEHSLRAVGLSLELDQRRFPAEKVKYLMRDLVQQDLDPLKVNLSDYLSDALGYNYSYLSHLFSHYEGMSIRDYGMQLRVERVKEMLTVQNLDLSTITERLHYSSVSHLSSQFKRITGFTTTEYRQGSIAA